MFLNYSLLTPESNCSSKYMYVYVCMYYHAKFISSYCSFTTYLFEFGVKIMKIFNCSSDNPSICFRHWFIVTIQRQRSMNHQDINRQWFLIRFFNLVFYQFSALILLHKQSNLLISNIYRPLIALLGGAIECSSGKF